MPSGRANPERTGHVAALDQPLHSTHGDAPAPCQLAGAAGVELGLGVGHNRW